MGSAVDPDAITRALHLAPSEAHRKGDPRPSSLGREYSPFSEGLWCLSSGADKALPLEEHLDILLRRLAPVRKALAAFKGQQYRQDIFIGAFAAGGNAGFSIPAEMLARLLSLGIDVSFDVYS